MSITDAFDAVITAPAPTPAPVVQPSTSGRTKTRSRRGGVHLPRRVFRVVYTDAADSWIVGETTPSIKTLWATTYADRIPADYTPLRLWCLAYRVIAVIVAVPLHILLFLFTHPLRGPIALLITAALTAAVILR